MWLTKKQWKLRLAKLKKVKLPKSSDKDPITKLPEAQADIKNSGVTPHPYAKYGGHYSIRGN